MDVGGAGKKNLVDKSSAGGSGTNSQLQGATTIPNVPSAQVQQKKLTNLKDVNKILKPALSGFMEAKKTVSEETTRMSGQCIEIAKSTNPSDTEQAKREKRIAIGKKIIAAHKDAIAAYDQAISQIKNIGYTVALRGKAAKDGVMEMFADLGLTEPKTMELLGKLREIRAEAYDDLQRAQALDAYLGAIRDHTAANTATGKIEKLEWAKNADPSTLNAEEKKDVADALADEAVTLKTMPQIYRMKNDDAITKYGACVDILASMPFDGVELHDSQPAKTVLQRALQTVLSLRKHVFEHDVLAGFRAPSTKVREAFNQLQTDWNALETDEQRHSRLGQLAALEVEAKKIGIDGLKYADRTIDLYDQALAENIGFMSEQSTGLRDDKRKFQEDTTKLLMDVFDMEQLELPLLMEAMTNDYDPGLIENYWHANSIVIKVKAIHEDCTRTLMGNSEAGVPEHLLHRALKTLSVGYEDAARQMRYLAGQFEKKGKAVANNDLVVQQLKHMADVIQPMAELAESQLGQVESAGKADQGTAVEAEAWVDARLRASFPQLYRNDDPVDEVTEELEELQVAETPGQFPGSSIGADPQKKVAPTKGPTPSQKDPVKELKKAIASAENALKSEQTQEDLGRLAKDSDKHSRNARQGAQEGASPCTVEDFMKLAAQAESGLAEKKTKIAKKFETALDKMEATHPKYQEFKNTISTLIVEAGQHKEKHDALLKEGEDLRIRVSKNLPPTHSLFNYLYDKGEVQSVKRGNRLERDSKDADGNFRINPRTNEVIKDYIDSYEITFKGGKKIVAHFHYKSMDANDMDIVACHFKTWEQRNQGLQYVVKEAKEGRDVELHRGRTNRETLVKLQKMTDNKTS